MSSDYLDTQFFRMGEMRCKDKDRTPVPPEMRGNAHQVMKEADKLRTAWGGPLKVLSAYRTVTYNASIGGARASQHCLAKAMDLQPADGRSVDDLWRLAHSMIQRGELKCQGLGRYDSFIHIDVRGSERLVQWDERKRKGK